MILGDQLRNKNLECEELDFISQLPFLVYEV